MTLGNENNKTYCVSKSYWGKTFKFDSIDSLYRRTVRDIANLSGWQKRKCFREKLIKNYNKREKKIEDNSLGVFSARYENAPQVKVYGSELFCFKATESGQTGLTFDVVSKDLNSNVLKVLNKNDTEQLYLDKKIPYINHDYGDFYLPVISLESEDNIEYYEIGEIILNYDENANPLPEEKWVYKFAYVESYLQFDGTTYQPVFTGKTLYLKENISDGKILLSRNPYQMNNGTVEFDSDEYKEYKTRLDELNEKSSLDYEESKEKFLLEGKVFYPTVLCKK